MIAALMIAGLLQASAPTASTSKWQVSPGEFSCVLERQYGSGDNALFLEISPAETKTAYHLALLDRRDRLPTIGAGGKGRVVIDGGPANESFGVTRDTVDGRRMFRTQLSGAFADSAPAESKGITIASGGYSVTLSAQGLAAALAALKACHAQSLREWGVDPAPWFDGKLATLSSPFFSDDAPKGPNGERLSGKVVILLAFDSKGRVTRCKPVGQSNEALAKASCSIAESKVRARPSVDINGQQIEGYTFMPITWP